MNIEQIMQDLDLTGPFDQAQYVERMESEFGKHGERFMSAIDRMIENGSSNTDWPGIYRRQSKNVEMSRLIITHSNTLYYKEMLNWLSNQISNRPKKVCYVGCNNGLFTLAVSKLWPDANILGVDSVKATIEVATKLGIKYGASNCKFQKGDLLNLKKSGIKTEYDLVLVPFVLHEIIKPDGTFPAEMAQGLNALVSSTGSIITINRFPHPSYQKRQLDAALSLEGLVCSRESQIAVNDENFPIYTYQRSQPQTEIE